MDCRKGLLLAAGLALGAAGCVTQYQDFNDNTVTTVWTPWQWLQKEGRRKPQVETCLQWGAAMEKKAATEDLTAAQKEEALQRARKAYQEVLASEADNAKALLGLARIYASLSDYGKAQATFDKATKLRPNDALVWSELGMYHFRQKHYDRASEAFRKATEFDPDDRTYSKLLSTSLALAGRDQDSIKVLTQIYGSESKAHYKFAIICLLKQVDQPDKARYHLKVALEKDPMLRPADQLLTQLNQGTAPAAPTTITLPPPPTPATLPTLPTAAASPSTKLGFRDD